MVDGILSCLNSNFVAGATSGAIAGALTYFGVKKTIQHEREKAASERLSEIDAFKKGIYTEIFELSRRYMTSAGERLENIPKGEAFIGYYPVHEDYFTVFNTNAYLLGKIHEDDLRAEIIRVYTDAKGLLDSFRLNNTMSKKYEDCLANRGTKENREIILNQLRVYTALLLVQHQTFLKNSKTLLLKLKN